MSSWCSCFMCQSVQDMPSGGLSTSMLTFGLITAGEADSRFGKEKKRGRYSFLVIFFSIFPISWFFGCSMTKYLCIYQV